MTDIQRWRDNWYGDDHGEMTHHPDGEYILYADHVEALAKSKDAAAVAANEAMDVAYEQGQRDALASYPGHTQLIADARAQGQRDMLARAIAAVEALCGPHEEVPDGVLAALRALGDSDA